MTLPFELSAPPVEIPNERPELHRVCLFVADLEGGGAERMMIQLADGIAARGVHVDLVVANAKGAYVREVPPSVRLVDLARSSSAAAIPPLASFLRRTRPDVLLSTLHHAMLSAAIAHRLAGVSTLHFVREASTPSRRPDLTPGIKGRIVQAGMRWVYATATGVLAVSEGVATALVRNRGVPATKVWTLYNPVITPDVAIMARQDPGHRWLEPGGPPVVLGVGSLRHVKRFDTLLEAFARVRGTRDVRLIILGEGPLRADLERRAKNLGVQDSVDMPGFVVNPFAYMARAATFVLSSEREGLPGVLIQAMACGCPVVATDCQSGPSEILEGGRHGMLVRVGDVEAMAAAITSTLTSAHDEAALRRRSRRFDRDRVVGEHFDVFETALVVRGHTGVRQDGTR